MSDSALHVKIKDLLYIFGLNSLKKNKLAIKTQVEKLFMSNGMMTAVNLLTTINLFLVSIYSAFDTTQNQA